DQCFKLLGGEGWVTIEQRPHRQQPMEQRIRNLHDRGTRATDTADLPDNVDVIDFFVSRNVVHPRRHAPFNTAHDDLAEVAHVKGLAHIAAMTGNGEYRYFFHKAGKPSKMLAIEPSEHQGGAQDRARNAAFKHQLFLLALAARIKVVGHCLHYRRADVHDARHSMLLYGLENQPAG